MGKLILPKIADSLYTCKDPLEVLKDFRKRVTQLPGSFMYRVPLDIKLEELENLIKYDTDHEQPFINQMKTVWAPDIRKQLISQNIEFDLNIRRKSLFSLIRKCNSIMAERKAIDSIHDLIGVEIIVYTKGPKDKQEDIERSYSVMNTFLKYLMTSDEYTHPGDRFLLCESTGVKGAVKADISAKEKRELIKVENENLFIPENSGLLEDYKNFTKDYIFQPKMKSFYQGLQSSICYITAERIRSYFEIQVKTQNQRKFLDKAILTDGSPNPGYHNNFRAKQNENVENIVETSNSSTPQFDLTFEAERCYHISGFRENAEDDRSGIIAPKKWSICNSTHA